VKQKTRITFGDLRIGATAKTLINEALYHNWITEGRNTEMFEDRFCELFGYKHAIAVGSGTMADIAACLALYEYGAMRGDEIIVPALSFAATANSVLVAGLAPKFVDCRIDTLNIDEDKTEAAITPKTKAIMVVHTLGKPCEMKKIQTLAWRYNLKLIEDCAEAHGAQYDGVTVGHFGNIGAFSFYVAHPIVAGEGGMVVTDNDKIAQIIRSVKNHGRPFGSIYFDFQRLGLNLRMNDLTAAIGIESLENFKEAVEIRRRNWQYLSELVQPLSKYCHFVREGVNEIMCPFAFTLVLKKNEYILPNLYKYLEDNGIQCKRIFGSLPTQHQAFKFLGYKLGDFPNAEYVGNEGLHFGVHQYLTKEDMEYVAEMLTEYFRGK
jgi:dTDP-4-amino-4,6-dideoxygalactose transaminase